MRTIVVVEDEMRIARVVRDYLEDAGFEVVVASDGESGLASIRGSRPDLVVLDLGLPRRDGLDVAREIRRTSNVPIVILTARGEEADRIVGLELGADDYVVKPFSPKELVARVRAVLRRTEASAGPGGGPEVLRVAGVEVDLPRMRVSVEGRPVELTPTEFQLLATFARQPGRVFTRAGGRVLPGLRRPSRAVHGLLVRARGPRVHLRHVHRPRHRRVGRGSHPGPPASARTAYPDARCGRTLSFWGTSCPKGEPPCPFRSSSPWSSPGSCCSTCSCPSP